MAANWKSDRQTPVSLGGLSAQPHPPLAPLWDSKRESGARGGIGSWRNASWKEKNFSPGEGLCTGCHFTSVTWIWHSFGCHGTKFSLLTRKEHARRPCRLQLILKSDSIIRTSVLFYSNNCFGFPSNKLWYRYRLQKSKILCL